MPWQHASDYVVSKPNKTAVGCIEVPKHVFDLLVAGDNAIKECQRLLPYGAGNQLFSLRSDYSAHYRTSATQQSFEWPNVGSVASYTMASGSGNCQDQAAVAYVILHESLPSNVNVAWGFSPQNKHSFCLIGYDGASAEEIVCVDSWPKYPQAVRWVDHFCFADFQPYISEKSCNKHGLTNMVHQMSDTQKLSFGYNQAVAMNAPPSTIYNVKFCTRDQSVKYYRIGEDFMEVDYD